MGSFFKISQVIQKELNQQLRKVESPEDFLHELITDLEHQEIKLRDKKGYVSPDGNGKDEDPGNLLNNIEEKLETAKSRYNFYIQRQARMEGHKKLREAMECIDDISRYNKIKK